MQQITVYSLVIDTDEISTQVFATEEQALDSLAENHAKHDIENGDCTRDTMLEHLTERCGYVIYLEEHIINVPTLATAGATA